MSPEMPDLNLLVSASWRAPGRARREIVGRLIALGDEAPFVTPTDRKGMIGVRTRLDPREVIRGLRALAKTRPDVFRYTYKWVPVDAWSAPDLDSLRDAVTRMRERIAPGERWRFVVERRSASCPPIPELIGALAACVDAPVDLGHPDKIVRIELFAQRAALAVVTPDETFSVRSTPPRAGHSTAASTGMTA